MSLGRAFIAKSFSTFCPARYSPKSINTCRSSKVVRIFLTRAALSLCFSSVVMLPTYWFSVWWCFWGAPVASVSISCPSCSATDGVVRNGKSTAGHQRYLCSHCRKTWQLQFTYTASQPGTHQKIIDMAMNGVGCRATARIMGVGLNTILRHLKNSGRSR